MRVWLSNYRKMLGCNHEANNCRVTWCCPDGAKMIYINFYSQWKCACVFLQVSGIGKVSEKMLNALGISNCSHLGQQMALLSLLFSETAWHHFMQVSCRSLWVWAPHIYPGIVGLIKLNRKSSVHKYINHSLCFHTDTKKEKASAQKGLLLNILPKTNILILLFIHYFNCLLYPMCLNI